MHDLKFFFFISVVIIGSILLGYNIAVNRDCTKDQSIVQCLSKETK